MKTGPVSCKVTLGNGQVVRRHIDHVRARSSPPPAETTEVLPDTSLEEDVEPLPQTLPEIPISSDSSDTTATETTVELPESSPAGQSPAVRRSQRARKAPDYLKDYA